MDQQKWLQSSSRKDPAWPSRDQIAFLLDIPPRSASLWRSVMKLIRSPSTNTPTPSIYSLITDGVHTARRHWVVIRGKSWLSYRHRCRQIVTKRVLNLRHRVPQQELVSLVTTKMIAIRATPEMGLVLQGILMIRTSVETKHNPFRTTEIKKKPH